MLVDLRVAAWRRNASCSLPTSRRNCVTIAGVRQQPRQIYTSVRSPDRVRATTPTLVRTIVVALVVVLALAMIIIAILSLA